MDRLNKSGKLLIHDPALAVARSQRQSYAAFVRQIFGYGRGRAEQYHISGEIKFFTLLPSLFILYTVAIPFFIATIYALPFWVYLFLTVAFSVRDGFNSGKPSGCLSAILYPTLHLCYGAGFIAGLLRPRFLSRKPVVSDITVRHIKKMDCPWPEVNT
jgi:hypothetical protein